MDINKLRDYLVQVASLYFSHGTVFVAEQKMSKHPEPYITLKLNNVTRSSFPIKADNNNGRLQNRWDCTADLEVNIYTRGAEVGSDNYINTSLGDMADFINFLDSEAMIDQMSERGVTLMLMAGSPRDLSGIINETIYRYRANAMFRVYFTDEAIGVYGQGGKTVPNHSGGGKQAYVDSPDEWFETVNFEEEKTNE